MRGDRRAHRRHGRSRALGALRAAGRALRALGGRDRRGARGARRFRSPAASARSAACRRRRTPALLWLHAASPFASLPPPRHQRPPRHAARPTRPCSRWSAAGADSVCLLRLLAAGDLGPTGRCRCCTSTTMLRGADADADAEFVRALCETLGVPVHGRALRRRRVRRRGGPQPRGRRPPRALPLRRGGARRAVRRGAACDPSTAASRSRTRATTASRRSSCARSPAPAPAGSSSIPYARGRIVRPLLDCDRADVRAYLRDARPAVARGRHERRHHAPARAGPRRDRARRRAGQPGVPRDARALDRPARGRRRAALRHGRDFSRDFAQLTDDGRRRVRPRVHGHARSARWRAARFARRSSRRSRRLPGSRRATSRRSSTGSRPTASRGTCPDGLRAETEYGKLVVSRAGTEPPVLAPCLLPLPGNAVSRRAGRSLPSRSNPTQIAGTPIRSRSMPGTRARWLSIRSARATGCGRSACPDRGSSPTCSPTRRCPAGYADRFPSCVTGSGSCGSRG